MNKQQVDRLLHLFRTCHALAENSRPFTDYTWHCYLGEQKGAHTGMTRQPCVSHIISRLKLKDALDGAGFISAMQDGSTDKSVTEQELIYVCGKEGVVQEQFLALEEVEKADAASLVRALDHAMVTTAGQPQWKLKLVAMATDGASVNTGKKSGVVQRIRDEVPHLIGVHCMAHRLGLALNDAAKKVQPQKTVNQLLLSLYLFYHNSALNRANLKNSYRSMDETFLVPTRVGGTR